MNVHSNAEIQEDIVEDVEDGVEYASLEETEEAPQPTSNQSRDQHGRFAKPATTQTATPAPAEEEETPEPYRGKSMKDVIRMHQEAQGLIGRQGQELGSYRKKFDDFVQADLAARAAKKQAEAAEAAPAPKQLDDVDFFAKPQDAVAEAIANHPLIKELVETKKQYQAKAVREQMQTNAGQFNRAHPDAAQIMATEDFQKWVMASPVRRSLLQRANQHWDYAAGNEIFSTYKELRGVNSKAKAEADAKAKVEADAKRAQNLKAAAVPSGGNATPKDNGTGSKKVYRRADIQKLMENNPDRYEQLADEIALAYAEGRVR